MGLTAILFTLRKIRGYFNLLAFEFQVSVRGLCLEGVLVVSCLPTGEKETSH